MATIGFIGLGNMGGPMVANLVKAGHAVQAFDLSAGALERAVAAGAKAAPNAAATAAGADVILTMLPAGPHVRAVWLEKDKVLEAAKPGALLIDSSTIDPETARAVVEAASKRGLDMLDAPVSGGVGGATAGTLTFMCGGTDAAFARAKPILEKMGKNIFHAGGPGAGQAAKLCNNLMMAIEMIAVSEGFALAEKLGLSHDSLWKIASTATSACWSMVNYCPVPGPVPTSPANRDYQAGFTTAMMLKDLKLAQDAAKAAGAPTVLGPEATRLFQSHNDAGKSGLDFSSIYTLVAGK
ncbi:MAG: 3-hydroxyisobutyrate dehydrogenase [Alphaproteobacteria bacterium]